MNGRLQINRRAPRPDRTAPRAPAACVVLLSVMTLLSTGCSAAQEPGRPSEVVMQGTELRHLRSKTIGREFDLYINLPGNYSDTTKRYPVIFVLDAQWDFPLVAAIYGEQYFDGFIPAAIIVGITWGGKNPEHESLRAMDLSPTFDAQVPQSGNGPQFLSFIKNEVIPFIDSVYRITDDRTLMGSSFGGLFTLYAMFTETGLFRRYMLTSPPAGWDNGVIYSFEREYAATRSGIPIRAFMASGELEEDTPLFRMFAAHLDSARHPGLDLKTKILEGMGHSGSKAEGFTRGLQAVFERPSLALDRAVLEQYAGVYETAPGATVTISVDEDRLTVLTPDGVKSALQAESDGDFYLKGQFLNARFRKGPDGKVTGFLMERYSREQFVKKIR